MTIRSLTVSALMGWMVLSGAAASQVRAADPQPIFYAPCDENADATVARGDPKPMLARIDALEDGVLGKAIRSDKKYNGIRYDGRGNIDLDRGTMAFFFKSNRDVTSSEWDIIGGVASDVEGYWGSVMAFIIRGDRMQFQLFDVGRYTRRLSFQPFKDRWLKDQWKHYAAVWDRNQGIKIYEDGKLVDSNWGQHHWEWNMDARCLHMRQPYYSNGEFSVDEWYVYADCLTDAQIAALASKQKPTGPTVPRLNWDQRRPLEYARMGWDGARAAQLPAVGASRPIQIRYSRVVQAVDAKRLVAQPFEGLNSTCWPLSKYGASVSGRLLELTLDGQPFDRVRLFAQRPFKGRLLVADPVTGLTPIMEIDAPHTLWRGQFKTPRKDTKIFLQRDEGVIGQIDFFTAEDIGAVDPGAGALEYVASESLKGTPKTASGLAVLSDTPAEFENAVRATTAAGATSKVTSSPMGGVQILSEPLPQGAAFDGVVVKLITGRLRNPTPVRVVVKEPIWPQRDWLVADAILQPGGQAPDEEERAEYSIVIKGRPVVTAKAGETKRGNFDWPLPPIELAVMVTASDEMTWHLGQGGTSVTLLPVELKTALPIATADQVEFAREAYAESNEGHIWDGHPIEQWGRLAWPMRWLMLMAPTERPTRELAGRVGFTAADLPLKEPVNEYGAPDWAFWQLQAMDACNRIVYWLIDHRELPNGEFGGVYGDDVDMIEDWADHVHAGDDDGKIREGLHRIYNGLWENNTIEGVSRAIRDALHSYEEGMGGIAQQLLVDYGDPTAVERAMATSSHYGKWMKTLPDGTTAFRSGYMGYYGVWEGGDFGTDADCQLLFTSYMHLVWYNHHPGAADYVTKYHFLPTAGDTTLRTAWALTGDDAKFAPLYQAYAKRVIDQGKYLQDMSAAVTKIDPQDEATKKSLLESAQRSRHLDTMPTQAGYSPYMTDAYWLAYKATGDVKYLTESYQKAVRFINSQEWLYTVAQPSTDRIPLPRTTFVRARLGGLVANRGGNNNAWPQHGISYTRHSRNVAALVTANTENELAARLWAFPLAAKDSTPLPAQVRVWKLWPGEYQLTLHADANNDGQPDSQLKQWTATLDRGAFIDLELPVKQGLILTIKAVKNAPPGFDVPDAAIGSKDVVMEYASGHLFVTVHNLGIKPVDKLLVRVRDGAGGQVIGEETIEHLDAPLDFKPRTHTVEFHNTDCVSRGSVIVELDPEKKIDDLNRYNNRVQTAY